MTTAGRSRDHLQSPSVQTDSTNATAMLITVVAAHIGPEVTDRTDHLLPFGEPLESVGGLNADRRGWQPSRKFRMGSQLLTLKSHGFFRQPILLRADVGTDAASRAPHGA
jgi:hypothetical protein